MISREELIPGSVWVHYKGGRYRLIGVGRQEGTEEECVIYQSCTDERIWIRPCTQFLEEVEYEGAQQLPRFRKDV